MSEESQETPFSESYLESPEYRRRLLRKLNTLIAVLEVACAKVRRSLAGPSPDVDRLMRIQKNLKDTLQVCIRAKTALQRCEKLPDDLPQDLTRVTSDSGQKSSRQEERRGARVEMSSSAESRKFAELGPIHPKEIRACDLDELCSQFLRVE